MIVIMISGILNATYLAVAEAENERHEYAL